MPGNDSSRTREGPAPPGGKPGPQVARSCQINDAHSVASTVYERTQSLAAKANPAAGAIEAAQRGWPVFPCRRGDKRPAITDWEDRASRDPAHVAAAWQDRYRGANVGIACGPAGLVVIDLDSAEHGGQLPAEWAALPGVRDGQDVLAALAERAGQPWPLTYTVRSASGGLHLYFTAIPGREIRNSAGKVGPMVDVRGRGGYIIGAGSVVRSRAYELLDGCPAAPLPAWLADLADPHRPVHAPAPAREPGALYGRLRGVVQMLLDAGPGDHRNSRLYWAACRAAELVDRGEVDAAAAEKVLYRAAELNGHVDKHGDRATRATIASGMRRGAS